MGRGFLLTVAAVLALTGCDGGSGDGGTDAGTPLDNTPRIGWLAEGVPPIAPPELTPCPEGWREVPPAAADGLTTCDAYLEGGPTDCTGGEAHFPGEPGCATAGAECPSGEWADGLADDGSVVFVRPGATAGDGSRAAPVGTIAEARMLATSGDTIALAKGRYPESARLGAGITLRGACAAETVLDPTTGIAAIVVSSGSSAVVVRDLRIEGTRVGVAVGNLGSRLELRGVVIEGAVEMGVFVEDRASIVAHELVVRDTESTAAGTFGRGLVVTESAFAEVSRAVFERNRETGVFMGPGTGRITLTDVAIRDTVGQASDESSGRGFDLEAGATAELTRVYLDGNRDVGIFVGGGGASLTLTDALVRGTRADAADGFNGSGLYLRTGARADVVRADFVDNQASGVLVADEAAASLSDVSIRDTISSEASGADGYGLSIELGASVDLTRAVLARNRTAGILVVDENSELRGTDVVVRDTLEQESTGDFGLGVGVGRSANAELDRLLVARNRTTGIFVDGASRLVLSDATVRDTLGRARDGAFGRGLDVSRESTAEVSRILVERNREVGIHASQDRSSAILSDVILRGTLPRDCAETTCRESPGGHGVVVRSSASMRMVRFVSTDHDLCGALIVRNGTLDLMHGLVSDNPVGVCLQVPGYDTARLTDGVEYRDNQRAFEATSHAEPETNDPTGL